MPRTPQFDIPQALARIQHTEQLADWDCGLACVSMVLTALNIPRSSPAELHGICPLQNIWTVDLAYILRRFGVEDFTYYTSYIGVNWQYLSKSFYRDSITEDQSRVHALFAGAADRNVRIVPMILDMNDIRRFLISGKYAVIILVNLSVLKCILCNKRRSCLDYFQWLSCWKKPSYTESTSPDSPSMAFSTPASPRPHPPISVSSRHTSSASTCQNPEELTIVSECESVGRAKPLHSATDLDDPAPARSFSESPGNFWGMIPIIRTVGVAAPAGDSPSESRSWSHATSFVGSLTGLGRGLTGSEQPAGSPSKSKGPTDGASPLIEPAVVAPLEQASRAAPSAGASSSSAGGAHPNQHRNHPGSLNQVLGSPRKPATPWQPTRRLPNPPPAPTTGTSPSDSTEKTRLLSIPSSAAQPKSVPKEGGCLSSLNIFRSCGTCTKKGYEKISGDDFVGHYILLAGYEPDSDTILYRDPGTNEVLCAVDADDLDVARSSLGTDHDAIVVRVA